MVELKRYYKIGEVCKIAGIQPHLLRYWEKEISAIRAHRSLKNHRLYSQEAVEEIIKIKLLIDEGYKLDTIKSKFLTKKDKDSEAIKLTAPELLKEIKNDLQKIKSLLEC